MRHENFLYRRMGIDDYDQVMTLWRATDGVGLRDSDSPEGIELYLQRNPGLSFVAEQGGQVVGTIMAGHDGKRGYIQHLAVAHDCRRRGIGRRLTEICLEALSEQGILKSHVHVYAHNESGRRFWEQNGWHVRDELAVYSYITGENKNI